MTTRFLKSSWAADVAKSAGFDVTNGNRQWFTWDADTTNGDPFFSQNGFVVKATKAQLKKLGLKSSATVRSF